MNRAPLVGEGRVAGDHHEPALLRQRGKDVLADAVAEIVLRGITAHVLEGEHRDRGAVRHARQGGPRFSRHDRRCHFFPDVADEAEALARNGLDQPLGRAVVTDRLARGVDPAVERRVRDDAVAPDLGDQVILADHPGALRDQIEQEVEHLRLQRHGRPAAGEFPQVAVEHVVFKSKSHVVRLKQKSKWSQAKINRPRKPWARPKGMVEQPTKCRRFGTTELLS